MGKIPGCGARSPFFLARPEEKQPIPRKACRAPPLPEGFSRPGSPGLAGGPPAPLPPHRCAAPRLLRDAHPPGPALTCGCGAVPPPAHRYGLGWGLGADGGTGGRCPSSAGSPPCAEEVGGGGGEGGGGGGLGVRVGRPEEGRGRDGTAEDSPATCALSCSGLCPCARSGVSGDGNIPPRYWGHPQPGSRCTEGSPLQRAPSYRGGAAWGAHGVQGSVIESSPHFTVTH